MHSTLLSSGRPLDGFESADIFVQFTVGQILFFTRKPVKNLAFKWISPSKQSGFDLTNFWAHNVLPIPSSLPFPCVFSIKTKQKRHKQHFNLSVEWRDSLCVMCPSHDGKTYFFSLSLSLQYREMHFMCLANMLAVVWLAWIIDRRLEPPAACLFVRDFE